MGLFDKVKDWFGDDYQDEEEEVEEIITEKSKVEITTPAANEKEDVSDTEALKEEKKPTSVFFDEKDFEQITNNAKVKQAQKNYAASKEKKETKIFRPTPIISPVYGILDKNYAKEDIAPKKRKTGEIKSEDGTGNIDVDWIRKKAYGTLDDDLEQELFKEKHILVEDEFIEEKDFFEEMDENNQTVKMTSTETSEPRTRSEKYEQKEEEIPNENEEKDILEDSFFYEKPKQQDGEETKDEEKEEKQVEEIVQKEKEEEEDEAANSEELQNEEEVQEESETSDELFDLVDNMYKKEGE